MTSWIPELVIFGTTAVALTVAFAWIRFESARLDKIDTTERD